MPVSESTLSYDRATANQELVWPLYRMMFQIRRVEESLLQLYSRGVLFGTVHTCIGQEACAVGVTHALDRSRDVVWSNHRGHGHYLAFTDDLQGLISETLGKAGGACGGIGGSQHLHARNFYSNGILGGTVACAVGCALAEKFRKSGAVVTVFFGDGALGEGVIYEAMNMASLWSLPVLFVLEDNGYAQSTPKACEHAGDIASRAETFQICTTRQSATDVLDVWRLTDGMVREIRRSSRPQMLALETYRLASHSKGDDTRDPREVEAFWAADPLLMHREQLSTEDPDRLEVLEREVVNEIQQSIATAIDEESMDPLQFLRCAEGR